MELTDLKGIASGRIFLVGNGPSLLKETKHLHALRLEATFCCNRWQKHEGRPTRWERSGREAPFVPTYYLCGAKDTKSGFTPARPFYKE